jgi:transcriptional regulator GlxA family with amidase domain
MYRLGAIGKNWALDNHEATSNKMAFEWVKSIGKNVKWKNKARWVTDGKYYTSSGVSAGIDMSLGFVCDRFGEEIARKITKIIEYEWNDNKDNDIFGI